MKTVENKGQFHTSNYIIGVDFVTDENSNSIGVIRYKPEFTDDGVSKIQYHNLVKSNKENIKSKLESPKNQSSYPNG